MTGRPVMATDEMATGAYPASRTARAGSDLEGTPAAVSSVTLGGLTDLQVRRLQRLVPLTENDIRHDPEWVREVLMRALDGERRRGRAIHWSYDINRHLALVRWLRFYEGKRRTL